MTITQKIKENYMKKPDHIIFRLSKLDNSEEIITCSDLYNQSACYAHNINKTISGEKNVIIIILRNSKELIYSFIGGIFANQIPSMFPFPSSKIESSLFKESFLKLIKITNVKLIITYPEFAQKLKNWKIKVKIKTPETLHNNSEQIIKNPKPDSIAFLQHSSGTTGLKKGVAITHQNLLNQITHYTRAIKLSTKDTIVSWLPLYHDMGLIACFLMPILTNTQTILIDPFDWLIQPESLLKSISKYQATLCWLPNFSYIFMAKKIKDENIPNINLSSIRALINAAEPISQISHEMFYNKFKKYKLKKNVFASCYGMAENTFAVTQGGIDKKITIDIIDRKKLQEEGTCIPQKISKTSKTFISSGTAINKTQIKIIDQNSNILPDRKIGEIIIKSDCMLESYYHRPEITKEVIINGWYHTGDLGYKVNDEYFITGRKKDMIIIAGKNIYPQDIDEIVSNIQGIHPGRVCAIGMTDEEIGTEKLLIIAETNITNPNTLNKIEREIRTNIATLIECSIDIIKLVPLGWLRKSTSGKISRKANLIKYEQELI